MTQSFSGVDKKMYETIVTIIDDRVKDIKITHEDFIELRSAMLKLAQAQERTEERLAQTQEQTEGRIEKLEVSLNELAQAQKRTDAAIESLAQAQKRTEQRLEELAQAQKRTDAAVERLAKAQERTDAAIESLAQAQKRTDAAVERLAKAQERTEKALNELTRQVGALSDNIGYGLEDIAYVVLPPYLEKYYGIKMDKFKREFFKSDGKEVEINLFSEGKRVDKPILILGEAKARIYKREVKKFIEDIVEIAPLFKEETFKIMFGFFIHPEATELANEHGIVLVASYQR